MKLIMHSGFFPSLVVDIVLHLTASFTGDILYFVYVTTW